MATGTEKGSPKREGKICAELKGISAEQAWPFLADFCNFHKIFPADECYQVEGIPGQPGLVRYIAKGTSDEPTFSWVKEKLIAIDNVEKCLSYEVLGSNLGFNADSNYVGTIQVQHVGHEQESCGCKIEWSFITEPNQSGPFTLETWSSYLDIGLKEVAKKIEQAVLGTSC